MLRRNRTALLWISSAFVATATTGALGQQAPASRPREVAKTAAIVPATTSAVTPTGSAIGNKPTAGITDAIPAASSDTGLQSGKPTVGILPIDQVSRLTVSGPLAAANMVPGQLAVRLAIAKRKVPFQERMLKNALISESQYIEAVLAVQMIEAEIAQHFIDLQFEIELLKVQRETRVADVSLAKARLDRVRLEESRLKHLRKDSPSFASETEIQQAEADSRMAEALVSARETAVKEADVRIFQAEYRLARIQKMPEDAASLIPPLKPLKPPINTGPVPSRR
jgi:hypothetical protein